MFRNRALILMCLLSLSCDDIIEVPDISEETVDLIAPTDGSVVKSNVTNFSWNDLAEAERYRLQVATPSFENASQMVIDSTMSVSSFTKQLLPNSYEWRVKALNSGYETGYTTNTFTVVKGDEFPGNTVILTSPSDNFNTNEEELTLSWEAIEEATEYRIQILDKDAAVIEDKVIPQTSYAYTFGEGTFTWKVRAQNDTESTLYSERKLLVDLTPPNKPSLAAPADASSQAETDVDFSWTRENIAGSAETDSIYIYTDDQLNNLFKKAQGTDKSYSGTLDAGATYYWLVKAFDKAGNKSDDSGVYSITIN